MMRKHHPVGETDERELAAFSGNFQELLDCLHALRNAPPHAVALVEHDNCLHGNLGFTDR
jgi:hypothetical protein